jgi:hypothetical protein
VPTSSLGHTVWWHQVVRTEAVLGRSERLGVPTAGQSPIAGRARHDVALADRLLRSSAYLVDPTGWAPPAGHAAAIHSDTRGLMKCAHDDRPSAGWHQRKRYRPAARWATRLDKGQSYACNPDWN